jgi:hypothetical protein
MPAQRIQIIAFFALLFAVYLALIPHEHTADAYGYAAAMGRGEWWSPHHLLYQPWTLALSSLWLWTGLEPILLYSILNSVAMVLALLAVYVLLPQRIDKRWWLIVVAFSFATLRFGTENETYAWPLVFSLWGTERLLKGQGLVAALCMAIAVLFHQIHVFWCLALLVYAWRNGQWQFRWFYWGLLGSALAVLCLYRELAMMENLPLWAYLTHDAQEGLVDFHWGPKALALSAINLIRSFIQVHASTLALFATPWVLLFVLAGLLLGVGLLLGMKPKSPSKTIWARPYGWVLLFQMAFAVFSQGNAEFMVMIPALLVLEWSHQYRRRTHWPIVALGLGLFLWNGTTLLASKGVKSQASLQSRWDELKKIQAQLNDKPFVYIARDKILLDNYMDYKNQGILTGEIWKSPGYGATSFEVNRSMENVRGTAPIYIDAKRVTGRQTRADWLGADVYNDWVTEWDWDPATSSGVARWWVLRNP